MLALSVSVNSFATERAGIRDDCLLEVKPMIEGLIQDCQGILNQADNVIREQQKSMNLQDKVIGDQFAELDALKKELDLEKATRDSWYKNPWIMLGIGVLAGGAGAFTLSR